MVNVSVHGHESQDVQRVQDMAESTVLDAVIGLDEAADQQETPDPDGQGRLVTVVLVRSVGPPKVRRKGPPNRREAPFPCRPT